MNLPKLRVVFAGTPTFAVPTLQALAEAGVEVVAVYTQPDRPAGRGRKPAPSPVKSAALELGVAVFQPESLRGDEHARALAELEPDVMIVVAYGLLLPQAILDVPRLGCLNVHASLLPRWRGAAPIQRAIEAGDAESGVCIMQMEAGLDTGPVYLRRLTPIAADETGETLHDRLSAMGATALVDALGGIARGTLTAWAQPDDGATYAHRLSKDEARVDWSEPAAVIARRVRAFNPWPVCFCLYGEHRLRLWGGREAHAPDDTRDAAPGSVVAVDRDGFVIATGDGALRITEIQMPGKRRQPASVFARDANLPGAQFT